MLHEAVRFDEQRKADALAELEPTLLEVAGHLNAIRTAMTSLLGAVSAPASSVAATPASDRGPALGSGVPEARWPRGLALHLHDAIGQYTAHSLTVAAAVSGGVGTVKRLYTLAQLERTDIGGRTTDTMHSGQYEFDFGAAPDIAACMAALGEAAKEACEELAARRSRLSAASGQAGRTCATCGFVLEPVERPEGVTWGCGPCGRIDADVSPKP
jgi:hypothetical protein